MAAIKKLSLAALIPDDALGTKFVATGFTAENYKRIKDEDGNSIETQEIECYYIGVQLLNPKKDELKRLPLNVKVKSLTSIDKKLEDALINFSIVKFENLKFGEMGQTFWANADAMILIENRGITK